MEVAVPHVHSASSTVAAAHHQPHDMGKSIILILFFGMQGGHFILNGRKKTAVN